MQKTAATRAIEAIKNLFILKVFFLFVLASIMILIVNICCLFNSFDLVAQFASDSYLFEVFEFVLVVVGCSSNWLLICEWLPSDGIYIAAS